MTYADPFLSIYTIKSPSRDSCELRTSGYDEQGRAKWPPVTNKSFYSTVTLSLVVKSMTLEGDKLGSAKDQSWDISRIISPPWGTLKGWWEVWALWSECIVSNFDSSTSDYRTATPTRPTDF